MVIVTNYELIEKPEKAVFCKEQGAEFFPCCGDKLKVVGSRERKCIEGSGTKIVLIIRRLCCTECKRIHHELPDMLVPYKRHARESIETVVIHDSDLSVNVDEI
ncbi:hypothetical protein ASZ90_017349 [hydrocarbon metagenome]|uniref:DUF6431 domain-containing protein n=1 Tax=hydrocarbon metagenome TaxID=938273 RepID=A0A0W8E9U8_9ZZZZ